MTTDPDYDKNPAKFALNCSDNFQALRKCAPNTFKSESKELEGVCYLRAENQQRKEKEKSTLFERQCISTNVQIRDTIFTSPALDRTAIFRGRPSQTKA